MKQYFSIRLSNFYAGLICLGLTATSIYMQFIVGLKPCPLCIIQRVLVALLFILFFIGLACRKTITYRIHSVIIFITALAGSLVAGRQVWLQHLPEGQVPGCGPGLGYMIKNLPLDRTIKLVLQGSGDCALVQWRFLGLSIPEWTLGFFIVFMLLAIINFWRAGKL